MHFLSADFIFDGYTFLPSNTILVIEDNGTIKDILHNQQIEASQHYQGMIMPGMINTHCHLELSHLKGAIEKHSGLVDFLLQINKHRAKNTPEEIIHAINKAEKEMYNNGLVAVGDICNTFYTLAQKQKQNLLYHSFVECFGLLDSNANERFESAVNLYNEFASMHPSSIVLHAPYSVSDKLIALVNETSYKKITTIHNQESEEENILFQSGTGNFLKLFEAILGKAHFFTPTNKTSLQRYLPKLSNQQKIILVHNTFTDEMDIQFAHSLNKELYWCLCPNANLYIENALPDIPLLLKNNCCITLGTDSLASNDNLNILGEILTIQKHFPAISLKEKLGWATINGAKALGIEQRFGSIAIGKKPGLVNVKGITNEEYIPNEMNDLGINVLRF